MYFDDTGFYKETFSQTNVATCHGMSLCYRMMLQYNSLLERQVKTGFFIGKFITTNDFYDIVSRFKIEVKSGD